MKSSVFLGLAVLCGGIAGGIWLLGRGADDPGVAVSRASETPDLASSPGAFPVLEGAGGARDIALPEPGTLPIRAAAPWDPAPSAASPPPVVAREWSVNDGISVEGQVLDVEEGEVQSARYGNGQLWYKGYQVPDKDGRLVREGPWEAWHMNGALHELGAYRGDVEHGPWEWWYENGVKQAEGTFDEGRRTGRWQYWYENGNRMMESRYHDGETTGVWTHYHENGTRRAEGEYVNGKLHGRWTVWNEDGSIDDARSGTYSNGVRLEP